MSNSNLVLGFIDVSLVKAKMERYFAVLKRTYDYLTYVGLDPFLAMVQFYNESSFEFYVWNPSSGAMGLGQQLLSNIVGLGFYGTNGDYNPAEGRPVLLKCREGHVIDPLNPNPKKRTFGFEVYGANIDLHLLMYTHLMFNIAERFVSSHVRKNPQYHPVFAVLRGYAGGWGDYNGNDVDKLCNKYHLRLFFRNIYFPKLIALYAYIKDHFLRILNRPDMVQIFNRSLDLMYEDFRRECPIQANAGYKPFVLEYIGDDRTKVPSRYIDSSKTHFLTTEIRTNREVKYTLEEYRKRIMNSKNETVKALKDIMEYHRSKPITAYDIAVNDYRAAYDYLVTKCLHKYDNKLVNAIGTSKPNEYMFYNYQVNANFTGVIANGKEYLFGGYLANGQYTPAYSDYKPSGGGIGYSSGFSNCGCSGVGQAGCTPKEDDRVYSQGINKAGCADCAKMLDSNPFNSTQFGTNCIGSSPDPTKSCAIESVNMQEYLKIFVGAENINENGDLNGELKMHEIKPYYFGIGVRCDKKELLYPKIPNVDNLELASVRYDNLNNLASFMNVHGRQNMVINCVTNIVIHATGTEGVPNPELLSTEKLVEGMRQISSYFILSPNNRYNQNPAGDKNITFVKFYSGRNKQEYQALNQPVKVENVKAFGNTENVSLLRGPSYHFIVKHYYGNEGVQLAELHDGITFEGEAIEDLVDILVPRKEHIIAISVPLLPNLYYDYLYGGQSDRDKIEKFIKKQGPSILPKYLTRAYATYRVDQENVANSSGDFVSMMTFPYGANDKDFAGLAAVYEGEVNGNHIFSTGWIGNVNTHADHYSLSSISIVYVGGAVRNGSSLVNLPTLTEKQQRNLKLLVGKLMYAYRKFHKMKIRAMGHNQTGKSRTYCPSLWVPSFFKETGLLEELQKEFKESTMSILCSNDPLCMKKALYENHKQYASAKEISEKDYKQYYCYALGDDKIFKA